MEVDRGFPPVVGAAPRVLILGSLPGRRSLDASEYYAQPQNAFWRIMGELAGAGPDLGYPERLAALTRRGIALWDVVAAGQRPGSLDASLVRSSLELNDFDAFFACHRGICAVCFNGRTAEGLYERRVLPGLAPVVARLVRIGLPSTSPAHAAMPFDEKLARWRAGLAAAFAESD